MTAATIRHTSTNMQGTEFPMTQDGRTYHVGTKKGEVSRLILQVGDPERARRIVESCFDDPNCFKLETTRGFTTYTGAYKGKRISVMAVGMGQPMTDFAVRETRAVADDGDIFIIRLGSCGTPQEKIATRSLVVAKQSLLIQPNYDALIEKGKKKERQYYTITKPITPDAKLHKRLTLELKKQAKGQDNPFPVVEKTDATAEFFYSTQGRVDVAFDDHNDQLIEEVLKKKKDVGSLQMETYQLFFLAKISSARGAKIHAAACAIVLANRVTQDFLPDAEKHKVEIAAGKACLEALIASSKG